MNKKEKNEPESFGSYSLSGSNTDVIIEQHIHIHQDEAYRALVNS